MILSLSLGVVRCEKFCVQELELKITFARETRGTGILSSGVVLKTRINGDGMVRDTEKYSDGRT